MYKETSQKYRDTIYNSSAQSVINIYIDEVLVNPKYITDFKSGCELFDENLELGSVPSQYIEMQIHKNSGISSPKKIRIEYGLLVNNSFEIIPIGIYNVDDYNDKDGNVINIKALDNIIKLEVDDGYYDASELIQQKGYATLGEIAQDICDKKGLELETSLFLNSNNRISVYDSQLSARKYMSYIAEKAGGFCCANRKGKIEFRKIGQDTTEIPLRLFKTYKFGEEYKISRVAFEDGIRNFKFGDETRNTLWIRQDNLFVTAEDEIQNIYDEINGLTISGFEGTVLIDPAIDIGDKIKIEDKYIIYQGEMTLNKRFIADIKSKISIKQKQDTMAKKESQIVINRRVQSQINQQEGKINLLVEETTGVKKELQPKNNINKTKNIEIYDAKEDNLKNVNFFGESIQETRNGYNLVKYSDTFRKGDGPPGIISSITTDGYLEINRGNSVAGYYLVVWEDAKNSMDDIENAFEEGDVFTIVFTVKKTTDISDNLKVYIKNGMGYFRLIGNITEEFSEIYYTGTWKKQNNIKIHLGVPIGTIVIKNWMIKKGEYAPYEKYGIMPSPEFPRFINSLKNINYKVTNKNKFDNREPLSNTIYKKEEDIYIFKVENIYDHLATRNTVLKEIKADTDYNIVLEILENTLTGTLSIMTINTIFENSPIAEILAKEKGKKIFTMHTRKDLDSALYDFWMAHSNAISGDFVCKIMITDSKDTTYQEHKEFTTTIELPEETELCNLLNGVQDYIDDTGLIHKKIKKLEIDSSLDILWSEPVVREKTCRFYIRSFDDMLQIQNNIVSYCTHFKGKYIYNVDEVGFYLNYSNTNYASIYFSLPKEIGTTVQEIKNWFDVQKNNGTPVTVYYELENEDTSKSLTDTEKKKLQNLKLFEGYNNITCNAYLSANYLRNTELNNIYENQVDSNRKYTEIQTDINGITNTVSETNSYIDNTIVSRIVKTEQSLDGLKISIGQTGGQNLIKNSTLKFGADKNVTTTGTVSVEEYSEILNNTTSKSAIKINNGSVIFNPVNTREGCSYTFSCLVNRLELANPSITITNVLDEKIEMKIRPNEFVEIKKTFTALSGQVQIKLESDNNYCLFSDCMLNAGSEKINWQLASGEIANKSVTISDEGAKFSNSLIKTEFIIDAAGNKIVNTETGETRAQFNADDTFVNNFRVSGTSRHGNLINTDFGDHIVGSWANSQGV